MLAYDEILEFAFPWLREHLVAVVRGLPDERLKALDSIASTSWPWTISIVQGCLPAEPALVTENLLHTLLALDPRVAMSAAKDLLGAPGAAAEVAALFIRGLPGRLRAGIAMPRRTATRLPAHADQTTLLGLLGESDPVLLAQAAAALGECGNPSVIPALHRLLSSPSPGVIRAALAAIGELRASAALDFAAELLDAEISIVCRTAAAEAMLAVHAWGESHLATIISGLKRPHVLAALRAMALWQPATALRLLHNLAASPEGRIRSDAVNAAFGLMAIEMGFPEPASTQRLKELQGLCARALNDEDQYVRCTVLVNLAESKWPGWQDHACRMLADASAVVRLEALGALHARAAAVAPGIVQPLLTDAEHGVRMRAFLLLRRLVAPAALLPQVAVLAGSKEAAMRLQALDFLARLGVPEGFRIARRLLHDKDLGVRRQALGVSVRLAPDRPARLAALKHACRDRAWQVREAALQSLREHGDNPCLPDVVARLADQDADVRAAALQTAGALAVEQRPEFAAKMLGDPSERVSRTALEMLQESVPIADVVDLAIRRLARARGESGTILLQLVERHGAPRMPEALAQALRSRSGVARQRAAGMLAERGDAAAVADLRLLLNDRSQDVRLTAFQALLRLEPAEAEARALDLLDDSDWRIRRAAIESLAPSNAPWLVEELLPLARDRDEDVRRAALLALAKFDDARVFSELVSSLHDIDEGVRELAQQVLDGQQGPVPSQDRLQAKYGSDLQKALAQCVEQVNLWASRVGQELLGRPVEVFNYRQGLGRTRYRRRGPAQIEVSDAPLTSGHPHGDEIMRGLALHEIGHHLCDFGARGHNAICGIARSEGLDHWFNVLCDERLERVLRSRRRLWGRYFDRLASYAFAQPSHVLHLQHYARLFGKSVEETRTAIQLGQLPGKLLPAGRRGAAERVSLQPRETLAIPGAVPASVAFLACFRCGFDPQRCADPTVAQAIALVPGNLKDLEHREVLEVARALGKLLGTSSRTQQDLDAFRRWVRVHCQALGSWARALQRMSATGQIPISTRPEAPGIREASPVVFQPHQKSATPAAGKVLNLGAGTDFPAMQREVTLPFNPVAHQQLLAKVRPHVRRLRSYLERLGSLDVDVPASRRGRRLDLARVAPALLRSELNVLIHTQPAPRPNAYLGILIDRSGSMEGAKMELAKTFGALLAESARGLPGLAGEVNAFDGDTFFRLGDFRQTAVASLTADDGNNDSGALAKAAELALASRKRHKAIVMISDGLPAECTFESLKTLVTKLGREHRIVCVQVAVDSLEQVAFPNYVDLSRYSLQEAVARFVKLLMDLTKAWR